MKKKDLSSERERLLKMTNEEILHELIKKHSFQEVVNRIKNDLNKIREEKKE